MSINQDEARDLLKQNGLRATEPRLAVLIALSESNTPLSYSDMLDRLQDSPWDPTTIYRNLIKLSESGLATIVSRVEGISRYALVNEPGDKHKHPHFVCDDCGQISCLPEELSAAISIDGDWAKSIAGAALQLRGECPKCLVS